MSPAPASRLPNGEVSGRSPSLTLGLLTLAFSIGFVDRQLLNLLVPAVKQAYALSDLQISLLQGVAFSAGYLVFSPLFGRWVDVAPRRNILLGCMVVWSCFTALCGTATGFASLFSMRAMVGTAEAGLTPAAWSILADRFDARRIGRAMSIYNMGPYVGSGVALLLGGVVLRAAETWDLRGMPLLGTMAPWQLTFVAVGAAGIACALLLLLIAEPARTGVTASAPMPLREALGALWKTRRFYGFFYFGMALAIVPIYGFPAWLPSVATRSFAVPIATVGVHYGAVSLIGGVAGVLLGPNVTALLGTRDAPLRLGVITNLLVLGCCGILFARPSYPALIAVAGLASFFYSMPTSMAAAALQVMTPNRMRGLATSIYIVTVTLMGLAVAPVAIAFCTDRIFQDEARVGDSLALVCGFAALGAAAALIMAMKAYRQLLDTRLDAEMSDAHQ